MTISLKIEIVKIFKLEFSLSSNKDLLLKKEKVSEESITTEPTADYKQ